MQSITTETLEPCDAACDRLNELWCAVQEIDLPARVRELLKESLTAVAMHAIDMHPDEGPESCRRRYLEGWRTLTEMVLAFAGEPFEDPPTVMDDAISEANIEAWVVLGPTAKPLCPADCSGLLTGSDRTGNQDALPDGGEGAALRPSLVIVEHVDVGAARGEDRSAAPKDRVDSVVSATGTERVTPSPVRSGGGVV